MIRLTIPSIEEDDLDAVRAVLETGYLVQGKQVAAFEEAVASYIGVPHAIAVSNCTAALHMSLLAFDVRPGDIVLVTAYSWVATVNVIELCGAQPVFIDIDPATFNMDVTHLESTLQRLMAQPETARRVRAIIPVHTFGQLADMPVILSLAARYNLPVIEDAACALGASLDGKQAGTWGSLNCFSFHPRKAITTGEGGIITTADEALQRRLRALRNHGIDPAASVQDFIMPGFNNRMTEFQAAMGVTQMQKLDRIIAARHERALRYNTLLEHTPFTAPVLSPAGSLHVYQSYVIMLPPEAAPHRARIMQIMVEQGIQVTIGTCHIPMTTYYRTRYNTMPGDFPATDEVAARSLTIPLHEQLTPADQSAVVAALCESLEGI